MGFNRDRFTNAPVREVSTASFAVIDALQGYSPEVRIAALTATLNIYARATGESLNQLMEVVNNLIHTGEGKRPEFRAIESYVRHETS